jgi:hypothetical protein
VRAANAQDALIAELLMEMEAAAMTADDGSMARATRLLSVGNPVAAISGFQPTAGLLQVCFSPLVAFEVTPQVGAIPSPVTVWALSPTHSPHASSLSVRLQRCGARLLRTLGDGLAALVTRARTGMRIAPELMDATQEAMGGAHFLINQLVAARVAEPALATALATLVRPKSIRIRLVR